MGIRAIHCAILWLSLGCLWLAAPLYAVGQEIPSGDEPGRPSLAALKDPLPPGGLPAFLHPPSMSLQANGGRTLPLPAEEACFPFDQDLNPAARWDVLAVQAISDTGWDIFTLRTDGTEIVRPAGQDLVGVVLLDERYLEVPLPLDLPPGLHDLWVINQGGAAAIQANAVVAGRQQYLPLVAR